MSQPELLRKLLHVLEAAGIPYMLSGSIVSSLQGEPRSTHDIDVVVELPQGAAGSLLGAFPPPDYYLDEHSIREAVRTHGSFNLLEPATGEKIDFWMLTGDPFDRSRFARRYVEEIAGMKASISRAEDTILQKLKWAEMSGGSERQFGDALRVYEVQHGMLDLPYIEDWAGRLGVSELWERLKREARPVRPD
jgi:hypothetical protein